MGPGAFERFDPTVGPDRYRSAALWLASSGLPVALASFTFDPAAPGSLVLAPSDLAPEFIASSTPIPPARIVDTGKGVWEEGFGAAMDAISGGRVEKVVLARQVDLEFDGPVPLESVVANLLADNPDTFVFAVDGLVGASPELLVAVDGDQVTSLVLAGTARTGDDLSSAKISEEHRHAADTVAAILGALTVDLVGEQSILSFGAIDHVGTRFVGRRKPGVGILELVAALHPTPALGGTPHDRAIELISRIEPRSRGRYGGPVGWFDPDGNGEFAIALRCASIRADRATLYAGGGLVADSTREAEFEETELKLRPMLSALGVADSGPV